MLMPRVSESYLTARRQQILEAAWRCFARDGFHATSMQDIFAEAGLSAGAVYRYFPSKLTLVKATAEGITQGVEEAFGVIEALDPVPPPDEAIRLFMEMVLRVVDTLGFDLSRVAVHVWSEALREPQVGAVVQEVGRRIRARWVDIAVRWKAAGHIREDADPEDLGKVCYGIITGFILQRHVVGDVTVESYVRGVTALVR
jgi:AcrR family transcriptional regulator